MPADPDATLAVVTTALAWILVVFMVVPEGFDYSVVDEIAMPSRGSWASRAVWLGLMATGMTVVALRMGLARVLLRWINPFLLVAAVLAVASTGWSVDANLTLRRLVRLAAVLACAGAFVVAAWHARRFQAGLRPVVTAMLLASLAAMLVFPEFAIMRSAQAEISGALRGITTQKNALGTLASFGVLFWLHGLLARDVRPLAGVAGLLVSGACLVLSRSSTSALATALVVLFLLGTTPGAPGLRRAAPVVAAVLAGLLALYSLAVLRLLPGVDVLLQPVAALTGKGLTFTGRTELWAIMQERIATHPWLGGGFGAYWAGPVPWSPSFEFVVRQNFYPTQAHNGYLDVLNDLGAVGLACLLGYIGGLLLQSLRLLRLDFSQGQLYVALVLQQGVLNLSESRWWNVLTVDFIILTFATFALARDLLDARVRVAVTADPPLSAANLRSG